MQKVRTRSQVKLFDKDILPTLKGNSASLMGRNLMSVSKFELDSNLVIHQQRKLQMLTKIQFTQNKSKNRSKIKKNLFQNGLSYQQAFKLTSSDSKRQKNTQNFQDFIEKKTSKNLITIQSSKTSTKSYGQIKGYAANSHPGIYQVVNEDRICIVTNLNKTNVKSKLVSFFSIYDGTNGIFKTDYYRDHFHVLLNNDQNLLFDTQKAIKNTIQKIQKNISSQIISLEDNSKVGYSILIVVGQSAYLVVSGDCKIIISKKLGLEIQKININSSTGSITKIQNLKKVFLKKQQAINVYIKKIQLNEELDFIILGSEGIYENLKEQQIVKKLWTYILKGKQQTIHICLGQSIYQLLNWIFCLPSTKNASLIMLGFKSIQQCIKRNDKIQLPNFQI